MCICVHLRYSVCRAVDFEITDNWHTHTHTHIHTRTHIHTSVCEYEEVTVLWHQGLHTDKETTENRSDIIVKTKKEKTCIPMDVAILADRNVYTGDNWCQRKSNKSFKEKFGSCTRKQSIDSLQKTDILGTSLIIRTGLQCEA